MKLFEGVYTALVTPFLNGKIDFESLGRLVDLQLKSGIDGFVVNGTTAESPTLEKEESLELLNFVKRQSTGAVKILFGSGTNNTKTTVEFSQRAQEQGADGLLVVVPYYNKPPQEGLFEHFKTVAESVSLPLMLYNVPGRTVTSLSATTIGRLSKIKNIQAIKEATGHMDFGKEVLANVPQEFVVSSGDDETCLDLRVLGGRGVVSVASHILPRSFKKWFTSTPPQELKPDLARLRPLIADLYISSNPIPVKYALHALGVLKTDEVRLPLFPLDKDQKKKIDQRLNEFKGDLL